MNCRLQLIISPKNAMHMVFHTSSADVSGTGLAELTKVPARHSQVIDGTRIPLLSIAAISQKRRNPGCHLSALWQPQEPEIPHRQLLPDTAGHCRTISKPINQMSLDLPLCGYHSDAHPYSEYNCRGYTRSRKRCDGLIASLFRPHQR